MAGRDPYFNPLDPDFIDNPYPTYARLREQQPVYWHAGMGLWLATRYHDCVAISVDHARFASDYRRAGVPAESEAITVQTLDPPEQLAVRRLLVSAVKSVNPAHMAATARKDASTVLGHARARGTTDFVDDVAMPFALVSAARIFGISPDMGEYLGEIRQIADSFRPALRPELVQPGNDARRRLNQVLAACYDAGGDTGIIGHVHRSPLSGEISRELVINSMRVTLMSIVNSTGRFFCLGLRALLLNSSLQNFNNSKSPSQAVNELVRFDTSFQVQERICVTPADIGGVPITPGERVVVIYGSANRDESVFMDPDQLILDRSPNPHLGFGRGVHSCPGSAITISLSVSLLGTMAKNYPETVLSGHIVMDANPVSRGVRSMPVRLA